MEVIQGATNLTNQKQAIRFLRRFELVEHTSSDFQWAMHQLVRYRLSHGVDVNDAADCGTSAPAATAALYMQYKAFFTHAGSTRSCTLLKFDKGK